MKFHAVHIVYQRVVSDYSLAITSLDLTDILCSDPMQLGTYLECLQSWPKRLRLLFFIKTGIQFTPPPSLDNAGCQESMNYWNIQLITAKWFRLFSSLIECHKTINSLNGLDPSAFFTLANDFRPLRANHRFKLKLASATLNSLNHSFFYTHNRQVEQFAKGNCGGGKFEYF